MSDIPKAMIDLCKQLWNENENWCELDQFLRTLDGSEVVKYKLNLYSEIPNGRHWGYDSLRWKLGAPSNTMRIVRDRAPYAPYREIIIEEI